MEGKDSSREIGRRKGSSREIGGRKGQQQRDRWKERTAAER